MIFKLLQLDIWKNKRAYEIWPIEEYSDLMKTARRVEENQWPMIQGSRLWLLVLDDDIGEVVDGTADQDLVDYLEDYTLDKLSIWQWKRE